MRSTDPYELFHLTLNKLPGQDPKCPPKTEWLNMGYWKDTKVFPEAAKALALKLVEAANLKEGGKVLDVGHGTGESLLLLLSDPSIPRPSHLVGITSLELHHQRSAQRVQNLQVADAKTQATKVDLYHGDAVYRGTEQPHPFYVSSPELFDSILVLDCAYHFVTRRLFLEQALEKLAPGGSIALADICFSSAALKTFWTRILTSILKLMPSPNLISDADYVAQMKELGFVDVVLEDITADVFPGFLSFLKSRGGAWWIFGCTMDWYTAAGAKFVIVSGKKPS